MTNSAVAFPVSFAQQRLWFLHQLEPASALYNVPEAFDFAGPVDRSGLAWCLNEVVRRHEALRTTFTTVDGQPVQVVAPELVIPLPEADLRPLRMAARVDKAMALADEQFSEPFDLERGPLLRALLVRMSDEHDRLLITMHHIVSDGWSLGVFGRELRTLYDARIGGEPADLPELAIQYGDFAVWQRRRLTGEVLAAELDHWTARLRDVPSVLALPLDRPRPAVQSFRGASQQIRIPRALSDRVRALSQREGVTVFMCLFAAFGVLIHRFTGQDDFVVGTPVAGRTQVETEGLIGCFVNALALRLDMADDPTFLSFLARVKELALDGYAHQELPFEKLVDALQPTRSLSYHPLFQVMFQVLAAASPWAEGLEDEPSDDPDRETEDLEVETGTSKFDLSMDVLDLGDSFVAGIEYSTDIFDHSTIRRMLSSFVTLIEDVVEHPDRTVSRLSILSAHERERALHAWHVETPRESSEALAHELFEIQATAQPDRVAVVSDSGTLTYAELQSRANKLANFLRRRGVGPEQVVAILVDRSPQMVVGVLGILKAGAAYLPLDPTYPRQRLATILADANVRVVVSQARSLELLPSREVETICVDTDASHIDLESPSPPDVRVGGDHLAYVIYTSGSTGRPKGVMIEHRALARWLPLAHRGYGLRSDDRMLQFASLCFDTSVEEIFSCLTVGATLLLRTPGMATSIDELLRRCDEWRATVLDLPTAFWHELTWEVSSRALTLPPSVRLVIVGGERAIPSRVAMWHRAAPLGVRLMQGYGPTEATIVVTIADLAPMRDLPLLPAEVPIGHVIEAAHAYVLDRHQQPVPVGVTGELYIGGDILARGYLHRPALTAERFVPDPFSGRPGGRLYRTGDFVRRLVDGQLEFIGRADDQVKVLGYRIEPAEIENALKEHPGVRAAVVTVYEGIADEKHLAAYIVADRADTFSVSALRESLRDKLPAYMVPASFTRLDTLPLTPTGKIDRRALPAPRTANVDTGDAAHVPPRTEAERVIASIWQEVFKAEVLGVHSNFFDLGGNSLTLVRVRSRLRDYFGDEISMVDMFRYPTISALADHVSHGQEASPDEPAVLLPGLHDRAAKQAEAYLRWTRAASGERDR